jgi:DNA-binding XRE family transcriptional regulator
MNKVQFIKTPRGDELAVLPRKDYEHLAALAAEAEEDAGTRRLVARARSALAEGSETAIPKDAVDRIAAGDNPIQVVREWRGMTQDALAAAAGISQRSIADLERGRRSRSAKQLAAVAAALRVPLELLMP